MATLNKLKSLRGPIIDVAKSICCIDLFYCPALNGRTIKSYKHNGLLPKEINFILQFFYK